jgi:hypothetical protein
MKVEITFTPDIGEWTEEFFKKFLNGMEDSFKNKICPMLETYAQINAPWTDQTGNARRKLNCKYTRINETIFNAALAHGVDYGIFLEKCNSGRYAILKPTIEASIPQLMDEIGKVWGYAAK